MPGVWVPHRFHIHVAHGAAGHRWGQWGRSKRTVQRKANPQRRGWANQRTLHLATSHTIARYARCMAYDTSCATAKALLLNERCQDGDGGKQRENVIEAA